MVSDGKTATYKTGSVLDHIFVREKTKIVEAKVLINAEWSDHKPSQVFIKVKRNTIRKSKPLTSIPPKTVNIEKCKAELQENWEALHSKDVDPSVKSKLLKECLDKSAVKLKPKKRKKKRMVRHGLPNNTEK